MGVHLVANITGTAAEVFAKCDKDKDGVLQGEEIREVLKSAHLDYSDEAVKNATKAMKAETNNVTLSTFTAWYLRCEERIKDLVLQTFDECDSNKNGMIEFSELQTMITKLTGKTPTPVELVQVTP